MRKKKRKRKQKGKYCLVKSASKIKSKSLFIVEYIPLQLKIPKLTQVHLILLPELLVMVLELVDDSGLHHPVPVLDQPLQLIVSFLQCVKFYPHAVKTSTCTTRTLRKAEQQMRTNDFKKSSSSGIGQEVTTGIQFQVVSRESRIYLCPKSHRVSYYINWVTTSRTYSILY